MADSWDHIDDLGWKRLRWSAGFVWVAGLFIGGAWLAILWAPRIAPPPAPPPAAVMIDLAPLPVAFTAPPNEAPPGPQQTVSQPPPPPEPEVQQPLPEAPPSPASEAAVPVPPKPKPVQHRKTIEHRIPLKRMPDKTPPAPETTAPPQIQAPPAPAAAPPVPSATPAPPSNAVPSWQGLLTGRLEQFKRYPEMAQERGEQGVAYLRFSMDRNGMVLSASIAKSSGYGILDEETLDLIHRAEPLPKPPAEVPGDRVELTVPIQYFLQNGN